MAFLDYLLGGVSGGFEGYERKKAKELQAQKDEEERQVRQLAMLGQLGYEPADLTPADTTPMARPFGADITTTAPKPAFDTTMNRAFTAATKRDLGVAQQPPSPLTTPVSLALDATKGRQPEQPKGTPASSAMIQANTPFGRMGFTRETAAQKNAKAEAAFEQSIGGFSEEEKRIARLARVLPSNVLQAITQPKEGRAARLQLTPEGQIINLDTREVYDIPGFKKTPKAVGDTKEKEPDVAQLRVRSGMNEMLLADRAMQDFENKFKAGQIKITLGQNVLKKLASDFSNESTALDKVMTSSAYQALANANPELVEYMRNVDAFAEGETMISSRPSNFRTKMAQFLSGIAAGSPVTVVSRVQQRRRGLLSPLVKAYAKGDPELAFREATAEAGIERPALSKAEFGAAWKAQNPKGNTESPESYALRMQQAWQTSQGGKK
jgi:hypothetical protein